MASQDLSVQFSLNFKVSGKAFAAQFLMHGTMLPGSVQPTLSLIQLTNPSGVCEQANFGDSFKIVGNHGALGNWNIDEAPSMKWNEGNVWTLQLPWSESETFEFKVQFCHLSCSEYLLPSTTVW